jgi:hypothetical protein
VRASALKDRPRIDPFSIQDAEVLITALHADWGEAQGNYDEFRFFTGLRPSEEIALLVTDYDRVHRMLSVAKARVDGIDKDCTKTYENRRVKLCRRAVLIVERQLRLKERLKAEGSLDHDYLFVTDDGRPPPGCEIPLCADGREGLLTRRRGLRNQYVIDLPKNVSPPQHPEIPLAGSRPGNKRGHMRTSCTGTRIALDSEWRLQKRARNRGRDPPREMPRRSTILRVLRAICCERHQQLPPTLARIYSAAGDRRQPHAPLRVRRRRYFAVRTQVHCFPWAARNACNRRSAQERTMDLQRLPLLAGRARDLLQQSNHKIGHNQSLDLIAALPGLRNWPEVRSFPDRVAACDLDKSSAGRLAFRLRRQFGLDLSREQLLAALDPKADSDLPEIWPTGPVPGVYLTTSQASIEALLARFEEASDGAVIYAERVGSHWDGSIDLGENGLWSNGLQRVPSGTLIVVGPIDLEQSSWEDSGRRMEMACYKADLDRHRVAVLVNTPVRERVCEDVHLLVRSIVDTEGLEDALRGVISEQGELVERKPFHQGKQHPAITAEPKHIPRQTAIPVPARDLIRSMLSRHRAGLVLVGAGDISEHSAIELVEACLALTNHCGAAARVMPRTRSTPSKYWNVPEAVKELPFLPSIQSAYDQGFRRMVVYGNYTDAEVYLQFPDVLFIASGWGCHVPETFTTAARVRHVTETEIIEHVLVILSTVPLSGELADLTLTDLYLKSERLRPISKRYEDAMAFLDAGRVLRWEEQFEQLCKRYGEERILQVVRGNENVPRMLGRLLDQLKQDAPDIAVDYEERRRSKAEIETKNVVLQLAARMRASSGDADGTMDRP